MPDGSQPCAYRASHEWDTEGLCKHCFAKRPIPNPYGWVANKAEQVLDEPIGSDVTPEQTSSGRIEILNWDQLRRMRDLGFILIQTLPNKSLCLERVDPE